MAPVRSALVPIDLSMDDSGLFRDIIGAHLSCPSGPVWFSQIPNRCEGVGYDHWVDCVRVSVGTLVKQTGERFRHVFLQADAF